MEVTDNMAGPVAVRSDKIWADVAVLGVAVVWGASYPVAKGALAYAPVLVLVFYRFLLTAVVMLGVAWRDLSAASTADRACGLFLGAVLFSIFLTETYGVGLTSATNTALIISLCTVLTPILDYGLSKSAPPSGVIVGAIVSCAGVGVLAGGLTALSAGDLLVFGAACLRAVMVVTTKRLMAGRSLSSAALTALQATTVCGLTLALLLAHIGPTGLFVDADARFWAAVAFLSLFCTIIAFYVQNAAVRRTSPTRVGFLMGTEPLFGFALAHLLLAEPLSAASVIGACLIVAGTFAGIAAERSN